MTFINGRCKHETKSKTTKGIKSKKKKKYLMRPNQNVLPYYNNTHAIIIFENWGFFCFTYVCASTRSNYIFFV